MTEEEKLFLTNAHLDVEDDTGEKEEDGSDTTAETNDEIEILRGDKADESGNKDEDITVTMKGKSSI